MKTFKRIFATLLTVLFITVTFAGCSSNGTDNEPVSAVIGVANTVHNAAIDVDSVLGTKLESILKINGSSISYYEIDGECYKLGDTKCEYQVGSSKSTKKSKLRTYIYKVSRAIKEAMPKTAEIDMLYALSTMSSAVKNNAYGTSNEMEMIIVSNLLSTKGPINFAENTIYFKNNDYIAFLKDNIPDMKGINVTWFVTEATGNQERLENSDKRKVKEFYEKLINEAGGTVEFIDENGDEGTADRSSWPNVSSVDVRKGTYNSEKLDITLEESTLFKSDSTEWISEAEAEKALQGLVEGINSSSTYTVVAGSTATTTSPEKRHAEFSKKRADKVRDKLLALGANKSKLVSVGIGKSYKKYRVPDTGKFNNEANKAKNRCVFIVSGNTEKAEYFLSIAKKFEINK